MTDRDRGDGRESIEGNPDSERLRRAQGVGHDEEERGDGRSSSVEDRRSEPGTGAGRNEPEAEESEK